MTRTEAILRARAEVQFLDWIVGILVLEYGGVLGRVGLDLDRVIRSVQQDLADEQVLCSDRIEEGALRAMLERSLAVLESLDLKALRPLLVEIHASIQRLETGSK